MRGKLAADIVRGRGCGDHAPAVGRVLREQDQADWRCRETAQAALGRVEPLLFGEDWAWSRRSEGAEMAIQVEAL